MPTRLVLCAKNAVDFAAITATPAMLATLPPSNLQLPARGRVARSTSAAEQEIYFTWNGSGYYLNFLMMNRHNWESGATWRVQLFSDAAWTNQIYNSGVVAAYDYVSLGDLDWGVDPLGSGVFDSFLGQKYSLVYFNRVLALSGKITVTNTGNSAQYLEQSRLYAGDYTELMFNPQSVQFAWDENTEQSRSAGGSLRSDGQISYRSINCDITLVDSVQRATLSDMFRYAGKRKDIFVSFFPGAGGEKERDYTMLAKFGNMPRLNEASEMPGLLNTQLQFQEV